MKLRLLRAAGIRGFSDPRELHFHEALTILVGPNGSGKTSVAEAIEWVLFGRISKHEYAVNLDEFRGAYRNAHYDGDEPPYGELVLTDVAGTEHVLRRELTTDTSSTLFVDGNHVNDLTALGVGLDSPYPVVAQHGLKAFLHAKGQDRWKRFSKLLGLAELASFRESTMAAARAYGDLIAEDERRFIQGIRTSADEDDRVARVRALLGQEVISKTHLLAEVEAVAEAAFPDQIQRPVAEGLANLETRLRNTAVPTSFLAVRQWEEEETVDLEWLRQESGGEAQRAYGNAQQFVCMPDKSVEAKRQQFLQRGLELLAEEGDGEICPFCGRRTITEEVHTHLKEALKAVKAVTVSSQATEVAGNISDFEGRVARCLTALQQRVRSVVGDGPGALDQIEKLGQGLPVASLREQIKTFSELDDECSKAWARFKATCRLMASALANVEPLPVDEHAWNDELSQLAAKIGRERDALEAYKSDADEWRFRLERLASGDCDVKVTAFLRNLAESSVRISVLMARLAIEERLKTLRNHVTQFEEEETNRLLRLRATDVVAWFRRLSPAADITLDDLEVSSTRDRTVRLKASSYGRSISASASLNECRENCIGLSIYLSQCLDSRNPFKFVLVDDPVQSMDIDHRNTLFQEVISDIPDRGVQVVYLTHLETDAKELGCLYAHYEPERWEFTTYTVEGPSFELTEDDIGSVLKTASHLKDGNSICRRAAATAVRQAVELLAKRAYTAGTGQPLSYAQRHLNKETTLQLAAKSGFFGPGELSAIDVLYGQAGPRGHTDEGVEPPTSPELESMIQRVVNLESRIG